MIEAWVEEDGGDATNITQNFPAPCTGCPTTSVGYTIQERDNDMGQTLIQFTDPIATVYNITEANVRRHSSN